MRKRDQIQFLSSKSKPIKSLARSFPPTIYILIYPQSHPIYSTPFFLYVYLPWKKKKETISKFPVQVLLGITDPELHILDEFEDVEYLRTGVEVSLLESSDKLQAHAYV